MFFIQFAKPTLFATKKPPFREAVINKFL